MILIKTYSPHLNSNVKATIKYAIYEALKIVYQVIIYTKKYNNKLFSLLEDSITSNHNYELCDDTSSYLRYKDFCIPCRGIENLS